MTGLSLKSTLLIAAGTLIGVVPAVAQSSSGGESVSMKSLLSRGFEIKAAAPNGSKYVVFMQKDKAAYACEFVTLKTSRCGAINNEAN